MESFNFNFPSIQTKCLFYFYSFFVLFFLSNLNCQRMRNRNGVTLNYSLNFSHHWLSANLLIEGKALFVRHNKVILRFQNGIKWDEIYCQNQWILIRNSQFHKSQIVALNVCQIFWHFDIYYLLKMTYGNHSTHSAVLKIDFQYRSLSSQWNRMVVLSNRAKFYAGIAMKSLLKGINANTPKKPLRMPKWHICCWIFHFTSCLPNWQAFVWCRHRIV